MESLTSSPTPRTSGALSTLSPRSIPETGMVAPTRATGRTPTVAPPRLDTSDAFERGAAGAERPSAVAGVGLERPGPEGVRARGDGLDAAARRLAGLLAKRFRAPESVLLELATSTRFAGAARLEAMKLFAVAFEAVSGGKLSAERAARVREIFLPALCAGRFCIELEAKPGAYASFDWERRVLVLQPAGVDVDSIVDRGHVLHEAEHVIQAAECREGTRYEFEAEGHDAFADYVLHEGGAVLERGGRPSLCKAGYDEVRALMGLEEADKNRLAARMRGLAIGNARAGRTELNGEGLTELSPDEVGILFADWQGAADGVTAERAFEEGYLRAQLVADPPRGEDAHGEAAAVASTRHAALATRYRKHGLLAGYGERA